MQGSCPRFTFQESLGFSFGMPGISDTSQKMSDLTEFVESIDLGIIVRQRFKAH